HSRRLRPAQERDRKTLGPRTPGAARHGDDGLKCAVDNLLRFFLRFLLVPLGYFVAVLAGTLVIVLGRWRFAETIAFSSPDGRSLAIFGLAVAGPLWLIVLVSIMWLPSAIGILISEAFALRSWMFHAANGVVSAWLGWPLLSGFDQSPIPLDEPMP